jgi:cytochrome c oxidase cbb3-type subunit 3
MSSRCPSSTDAISRTKQLKIVMAVCALAALLGGCERERREYTGAPELALSQATNLTELQPGAPQPTPPSAVGSHYENNAFHVNEGGRWYKWFNCNGCHANGGGAIGPALMDAQWRYGGSIDQIHASIMEGRPNGMPAWRGKLTDQQAWQLAVYVRALAGNVRKDAVPSRREGMSATPPLTRMPEQPPQGGNASAQTVPPQ